MNRYRVSVVPRGGRFAPVLTVLVEADTPDEASRTVEAGGERIKVISAEVVSDRPGRGGPRPSAPAPRLRLLSP